MSDLYFLIEFPIFRDFSGDDIDALGPLCEERSLEAGAAVVKEGEPADAMYVVKSGVLEVSKETPGGRQHINLLSGGEFFGEMALIDGSPRSADVWAKEAAVLIRLSSEAFKALRQSHPATALKIADVLLKTLSFRVRRSTTRALASEAPAPKPKAPKSKAKKKKKGQGKKLKKAKKRK
jgi:CRP-like cAMP-binding protein